MHLLTTRSFVKGRGVYVTDFLLYSFITLEATDRVYAYMHITQTY